MTDHKYTSFGADVSGMGTVINPFESSSNYREILIMIQHLN